MKRLGFKRIAPLVMALSLLFSIAASVHPGKVAADASNLIANPSAETADSVGGVLNWTPNSWGTSDTTLSASSDAHSGTKAFSITTKTRTDGDAKWIADPIAVTAGSQYTFSDFYKSDVATEIDAAYYNASGAVSYYYIASAPASTGWSQTNTTFTVPASAVKVSLMHILPKAGSLTTDDYSLTAFQAPAPTPTPDPTPTPPPIIAPTPTTISINDSVVGTSANQFTYSGAWITDKSYTGSYNGDIHYSTSRTAFYQVKFSGTQVKLYAPTSNLEGIAGISIDGGKETLVDAYASKQNNQVLLYTSPVLANGAHTIKVRNTGTKNRASFGTYLIADRVDIMTTDATTPAPTPTPNPVPTPTGNNLIANPSVETASGTSPAGWQNSAWGTNTPAFTYAADAHTGTKSLKTEFTTYTDGDAKWFFNPVTGLQSGKTYTFSTWVKSTAQVSAVAAFTMNDGTTQYQTLSAAPAPNTIWQQYATTFGFPVNAKDATVYMLISSVGWAETDDYSLAPYVPQGFAEGMVSLTFDDGWTVIYNNGLPILKKYGFVSTQYIISGYIGAPGYMTAAQVRAFQTQGSEIGSHTVSHPDLTTLNSTDLTTELQQSQKILRSLFGATVAGNLATPYGAYNSNVLTQSAKYYRSQRGVDTGFNSKDNLNIYNIVVQNVDADTSNAQVQAWVNQAKAEHTWLVLVYHQVENTIANGDIYAVKTSNLDAQLSYIKSTGIPVKTVNDALNIVTAQK